MTVCARESCGRQALPGRAECSKHDVEHMRELGRRGAAGNANKVKAERRAVAETTSLGTIEGIRSAVDYAAAQAISDGELTELLSACRTALKVFEVSKLANELAELRRIVSEHIPGAAQTLGIDHVD